MSGDGAGEGVGVTRRADRFEIFPSVGDIGRRGSVPRDWLPDGAAGLTCAVAGADNRVVTANAGDGADLVLINGTALSPVDAVIDGGAGNDDLRGGPGPDLIDGGADNGGGVDTLRGEGGNDVLRALAVPRTPSPATSSTAARGSTPPTTRPARRRSS